MLTAPPAALLTLAHARHSTHIQRKQEMQWPGGLHSPGPGRGGVDANLGAQILSSRYEGDSGGAQAQKQGGHLCMREIHLAAVEDKFESGKTSGRRTSPESVLMLLAREAKAAPREGRRKINCRHTQEIGRRTSWAG